MQYLAAQVDDCYRNLALALQAMNAAESIRIKHEGQPLLYRLIVVSEGLVKIEGFVPGINADQAVNARSEFMHGVLWVAPRGVVLEDYVSRNDGCALELVKVFHQYRDARYERFNINPEAAVVKMLWINGQLRDIAQEARELPQLTMQ